MSEDDAADAAIIMATGARDAAARRHSLRKEAR
jgi:hypothetical protein